MADSGRILKTPNIHEADFIEALFDEMSATYGRVNFLSSFGFSRRWRRQFVREASIGPGMAVCDLMCGAGECWDAISLHLAKSGGRPGGRLHALDFSGGMLRKARKRSLPGLDVTISRQDALASSLEDGCADRIVCGFGVKTLSGEQKEIFASEVARVLKPGGAFSLVEVSVPRLGPLKSLYMFYLKEVIPLIGRMLLGNPDNYRMLGVYTEDFGDCRGMRHILERQGLRTKYHEYFFGCASGVSGVKPRPGRPPRRFDLARTR